MKHAAIALLMVLVLLAGCVQVPQQPGAGAPLNASPAAAGATSQGTGTQQQQPQAGAVANQTTTGQPNATTGQQAQAAPAMPSSEEVVLTTTDSWKIYGTLYPAKSQPPKTGVILLHQLGSNRSSYDPLVPALHDCLPNADILAIDMRGQGQSTNIGKYTGFMAGDYRAMVNDIKAAKDYLAFFRHTPDNYYLVGASVGATAAMRYAAADASVQAVVMLSPGMNYQGVDMTDALNKVRKRVYIAVAKDDGESAADSQAAYAESKAYVKDIKIYETIGAAHGTDMFNATESSSEGRLTDKICGWLQ
jgi:alpha-beta hydrolase superfamily lysophospholipase